jgi:hypothetical protein
MVPKRPLILPPRNVGWNEHHAYPTYYGRPNGKVWSAKLGRTLKGSLNPNGYNIIGVDGMTIRRSRFNLSLALERPIKEAMECDHIIPIKEGGGDEWSNLQELTKDAHRLKTVADNPDAGKKREITQGIPIIARHAGTGLETRFDSVKEAVRELGFSDILISRSLKGETIKGDYIFSRAPEHLAEQADLPGERWLQAVSSWGLLPNTEASDRGRIQDSRGRRSYGSDSQQGYKVFGAMIDKKKRNLKVHNVLGRTFLDPAPSSAHTVDHINGDPSDNRVENLRWATKTEQGRNMKSNRSVVQLNLITGAQLAVFGTIAAAAEALGIFAANIGAVAKGRQRTAGGFKCAGNGGGVRICGSIGGFLTNATAIADCMVTTRSTYAVRGSASGYVSGAKACADIVTYVETGGTFTVYVKVTDISCCVGSASIPATHLSA